VILLVGLGKKIFAELCGNKIFGRQYANCSGGTAFESVPPKYYGGTERVVCISLTSWFGRGLVTSEIGAGDGDEALIRSSVATRTKEVGGDTTFAGLIRFGSSIYSAGNSRKMSFAEMLAELELKRTENTLGI